MTLNKSKRGQPKADIDVVLLEELCGIGCTFEEIAGVLGITKTTIMNRQLTDPDIRAAIDRGRSNLKISVRRQQLKMLMQGNSAMGVWLGKQILGQTDQLKIQAVGADDGPIAILDSSKLSAIDDAALASLITALAGLATSAGGGAEPPQSEQNRPVLQ